MGENTKNVRKDPPPHSLNADIDLYHTTECKFWSFGGITVQRTTIRIQ